MESSRPWREAGLVMLAAGTLYAVSSVLLRLVRGAQPLLFSEHAWLGQVAIKSVLLLIAVGGIALTMQSDWRRAGFQRPQGARWGKTIGLGLLLGALATLLVLLSGGKGMRAAIGNLSFPQLVLVVWFWSSFTEEVFARGWVQSVLDRWESVRVGPFSLPVVAGAVLFSLMHLSILFVGVDPVTAAVILPSTLLVGLWAGVLKERTGSLLPAFAAHAAFNVGGVIGGAIYVAQYALRHGRPPTL